MQYEEILTYLKSQSSVENAAGMARFGINAENTLGVSVPVLRALAKKIGHSHPLAGQLWASGIHEARILATMIEDPGQLTDEQVECWLADFDSWDVCDQCCMNLLENLPDAYAKAVEWAGRDEEFVKRAGFALMACLAWHDKKAADDQFVIFFPVIQNEATDGRNFVKKAVNWALRNIGKRNPNLNRLAIENAREIGKIDSKIARWIASDALRELLGETVQKKLGNQS
jgi:3-methyladenine DNA glycosylase AlkD